MNNTKRNKVANVFIENDLRFSISLSLNSFNVV